MTARALHLRRERREGEGLDRIATMCGWDNFVAPGIVTTTSHVEVTCKLCKARMRAMRRDEPVSSETYGVEVAAHRGRALLTTQDRRAIERSRRGEENVRPRWGTLAAAWQQWARTDPRNEEARRRGLATGARVRLEGGQAHLGTVCGFDTDGDPIVVVPHGIERYYAFDLVTDTEATT